MRTDRIATIILAAGASSRLGTSKQLLIIDNDNLLTRTIKTSLTSEVIKTIVVLGAYAEMHRNAIDKLPVDIIINEGWQSGMGSSIKAGVQHALKSIRDADGVIIVLCDQPMLTANHINTLLETHRQTGKTIIASRYGSSNGVPALFQKSHFNSLINLDGKEGAKKIIQMHSSDTMTVDFPGGEFDIDTQEDYKRFLNR
jgi:molybdenum cofactor cytidylyltransferase